MLECDVHLTKDGVVIVAHDTDLWRICGVNKQIHELDYAELPTMQRRYVLHFTDNELYHLRDDEDGQLLTLRELFEMAPESLISVDLKGQSNSPNLCHKVNELIKEYKREELTIWGAMAGKPHKETRLANPAIPQFFSGPQTLTAYLLYFTGLIWLWPLPADAFMVPLFTRQKVKLFSRILDDRGSNIFVRMLAVLMLALLRNSRNLYRHLRARGIPIIVWVLNEEEEFQEALDCYGSDIDGMMTDRPTLLKEFMAKVK